MVGWVPHCVTARAARIWYNDFCEDRVTIDQADDVGYAASEAEACSVQVWSTVLDDLEVLKVKSSIDVQLLDSGEVDEEHI